MVRQLSAKQLYASSILAQASRVKLGNRQENVFIIIYLICPGGEIGIRSRLKICRSQRRAGSSPAPGTSTGSVQAQNKIRS